jgi:Family of unknown function (DUF5996)
MNFPQLTDWVSSGHRLHQAAQLVGAVRLLVRDPVPNYLELGLRAEPTGLSTERLPSGGELRLDFGRAAMVCISKDGQAMAVPLDGHTQATLLEATLSTLSAQGQPLVAARAGAYTAAFTDALKARGHSLSGSLQVTGTEPLEVNRAVSADYGQVLDRVYTATSRWRSRLSGFVTPLVVWPEHFDLSTLWFATPDSSEQAPHMNYGFAPFDAEFTEPYLYAYAHPMPEEFGALPLPAPARWHTAGWQGVVVHYEDLARAEDPEGLIEFTFEAIHAVLAPTLKR